MSDQQPREQALVFGEIAEQYDAYRPTYPDALFDAIIEFGALEPGDAVLEIGAGTGKATMSVMRRGLAVHALEPSPGMAQVLRAKGVPVEEVTLAEWPVRAGAFRLAFAAQSWHWVQNTDRYEKVAAALAPGGTLALFWNVGRPHPEPFKAENDALYRAARSPARGVGRPPHTRSDSLVGDVGSCDAFSPIVERTITWETSYSSEEWVRLLETHSDHRMLHDDVRADLHVALGALIDEHGGRLPVVYDTRLYLATRR